MVGMLRVELNVSDAGGALVICEPPGFVGEFPPKRLRPLSAHISLRIDGVPIAPQEMKRAAKSAAAAEIRDHGEFCHVVSTHLDRGQHAIEVKTSAVAPEFVLISQVIWW